MKQPWIAGPGFDTAFILLPPFAALLGVLLLPAAWRDGGELGLMSWVILVLLVDVAHVYSTLFRTYLHGGRFGRHRTLYLAVPAMCYVLGVGLFLVGGWLFWRVLAYAAVFHFIRQQYGFVRLYSRTEHPPPAARLLDTVTVYAATLYPLLYWHLEPGRKFSWFVQGDFLQWENPLLLRVCGWLYLGILAAYAVKEMILLGRGRRLNIPRNALILGTALSWYLGIVRWNGDLVFTMLNVLSHGIPYMALIWHRSRQEAPAAGGMLRVLLRPYGAVIFVGIVAGVAWLEEGLWDGMIWDGEHAGAFSIFQSLPQVESPVVLAFLVPLLALPQATHYVLDSFIWRRSHN